MMIAERHIARWAWVMLVAVSTAAWAAQWPDPADLPDRPEGGEALVMFDGTPVHTAAQWAGQRRGELIDLFEHYMYGRAPAAPDPVAMRYEVELEDPRYFDGAATLRLVTIRYPPAGTPPIHLLLVMPNGSRPVAVFTGLNFAGNHAVLNDRRIGLCDLWMYDKYPGVVDHRATEASRGAQVDVWNIEKVIARGYAVATFYNGDVDADRPDFSDGVHPAFYTAGQDRPGRDGWGTIAAWAWGLQRAVDYLLTEPRIRRDGIIAIGHSRLGKTALLAAALDERIAMAIPSQSGTGGAAPSRAGSDKAESIARINTSFPHWFNDNFKQFNDHVDKLPFDQHCLVALMAPRPVLLTNAADDLWANPAGQFAMLQRADAVYRLLGAVGLGDVRLPSPGTVPQAMVGQRLAFFLRPGGHAMTWTEWEAWIAFADRFYARAPQ